MLYDSTDSAGHGVSGETGGLTVGVDLGGTKIAAGMVAPGGAIVSRVRVPTPQDPDRVIEAIVEVVQQVCKGWDDVRAVGVGAAGYVDADRSTVRFAPNLGFHDKAIGDLVQQAHAQSCTTGVRLGRGTRSARAPAKPTLRRSSRP